MKKIMTLFIILCLFGCSNPFASKEDKLFARIVSNQKAYDSISKKAMEKQKPVADEIIADLKELNILNHNKANDVIATYFPRMKPFEEKKEAKKPEAPKPAITTTTGVK